MMYMIYFISEFRVVVLTLSPKAKVIRVDFILALKATFTSINKHVRKLDFTFTKVSILKTNLIQFMMHVNGFWNIDYIIISSCQEEHRICNKWTNRKRRNIVIQSIKKIL